MKVMVRFFWNRSFKFQKAKSRTRATQSPEKQILDLSPFSEVNDGEKEEIKEDDFKNGRGGDEKGCIGEGGEEGDHLEEDRW